MSSVDMMMNAPVVHHQSQPFSSVVLIESTLAPLPLEPDNQSPKTFPAPMPGAAYEDYAPLPPARHPPPTSIKPDKKEHIVDKTRHEKSKKVKISEVQDEEYRQEDCEDDDDQASLHSSIYDDENTLFMWGHLATGNDKNRRGSQKRSSQVHFLQEGDDDAMTAADSMMFLAPQHGEDGERIEEQTVEVRTTIVKKYVRPAVSASIMDGSFGAVAYRQMVQSLPPADMMNDEEEESSSGGPQSSDNPPLLIKVAPGVELPEGSIFIRKIKAFPLQVSLFGFSLMCPALYCCYLVSAMLSEMNMCSQVGRIFLFAVLMDMFVVQWGFALMVHFYRRLTAFAEDPLIGLLHPFTGDTRTQ